MTALNPSDGVENVPLASSTRTTTPSPQAPRSAALKPYRESKMAMKFLNAPPGAHFEDRAGVVLPDVFAARTGYYFFYGTLQDPRVIADILGLQEPPLVQPAQMVGYHLRLWGPFPALLDGPPGNVVKGVAYDVKKREHAERLAEYETDAYIADPAYVDLLDKGGKVIERVRGSTFAFVGDRQELSDGVFDLGAWQSSWGR